MGPEPLSEVEVSWHGLAADRRWAFVRDGVASSGFPCLTLRGRPALSPNLLVDAAGDAPFSEDAWVGSILRIGHMQMRVDERDQRCMVVNINPTSTGRVAIDDPVLVEND